MDWQVFFGIWAAVLIGFIILITCTFAIAMWFFKRNQEVVAPRK